MTWLTCMRSEERERAASKRCSSHERRCDVCVQRVFTKAALSYSRNPQPSSIHAPPPSLAPHTLAHESRTRHYTNVLSKHATTNLSTATAARPKHISSHKAHHCQTLHHHFRSSSSPSPPSLPRTHALLFSGEAPLYHHETSVTEPPCVNANGGSSACGNNGSLPK